MEGEGFMSCITPSHQGARCFGYIFGELTCSPTLNRLNDQKQQFAHTWLLNMVVGTFFSGHMMIGVENEHPLPVKCELLREMVGCSTVICLRPQYRPNHEFVSFTLNRKWGAERHILNKGPVLLSYYSSCKCLQLSGEDEVESSGCCLRMNCAAMISKTILYSRKDFANLIS